jgi:L-rhamnonate dehydratase
VVADDGSVGFAVGAHGKPVATIIEEYLGPRIVGEDCMATEKTYDMMVRLCAPFGAAGLASFAVSAIDLALWDLKGKVSGKPVYELIGGQTYDDLPCYMTGNDPDWAIELGFQGVKLACPYGPYDGLDGLRKNVDLVRETRELIGPNRELMLDCWMALDVEYAVRLAEELRPFKMTWLEECLPSEDIGGHITLRERLTWQTLATGEHWFTPYPFQFAAERHLVDIVQPDIAWVGGMTAMLRIYALAEAAGVTFIPHVGANDPYGQHACYGLPGIRWAEWSSPVPPGVPLAEMNPYPGMATPVDGRLKPSDAPGFGVDLDPASLAGFLR